MIEFELTNRQYEYIEDDSRELLLYGGANSGRTIFAITKTIICALQGVNKTIIVVTKNRNPKIIINDFKNELNKKEIDYEYDIINNIILLGNNSEIRFISRIDDCIHNGQYDIVYIENEIDDKYNQLTKKEYGRLIRTIKPVGQMLLVTNPSETNHWIYKYFIKNPSEDSNAIHWYYKNNSFLPEEVIEYFDNLCRWDEKLYHKYGDGSWSEITYYVKNIDTGETKRVV
ncbi:phage terminase large subunit [Methanobrevibacter sp. DSM 116169]|uniref:phage terminase large subunit n=1 Tax=Methanobrevibacter sp. DSM 116169 TaxID=3242727 RepID=UPI0038FCFB2F